MTRISYKAIFENQGAAFAISPALVYKISWLIFLYLHYFQSHPSHLIPVTVKILVGITGLLSVGLHKFDTRNYVLFIHKLMFLVFSFIPFAIDNRTTVALFESVVVMFYLIKSPTGFPNKQAYFWLLGLTLFFAGFHKINSAHLFFAGSCSAELVGRGLALFQLPVEYSKHALVPWLVVGLELLVPVGLVLRCYRATLWLLSFLTLSFTLFGYGNFASLVLVLSIPLFYKVQDRRFKNMVLIPWVVCFGLLAFLQPAGPLLLSSFGGIVILFLLANTSLQGGAVASSKGERVFIGLLAGLFILNSVSIYFGYKNQGVLSMYSNLQVYDDHSNHLLIPRPWALSNNLSGLVRIVSSDQPQHRVVIEESILMPLKLFKMQARNWLNWGKTPSITYIHQGLEHSLKSREDLVKFTEDLSFMDLYFLSLGYVAKTDLKCHW